MTKINPHEALNSEDTKLRNAAIVYLHEDRGYDEHMLHKLCTLAISTIRSYFSKFRDLLAWGRKIFTKAKNYSRKKAENFYVYIEKITMGSGEIWCKIGQTTRDPEQRAKELKYSINGEKVRPVSVDIINTITCKDATSMQNMEDCLRLGMTAIDPDGFIPNDRLDSWEDDYPQRILNNNFVRLGIAQFAAQAI